MRTVPDCLVCILGDVFAAARQTTDEATALEVARAASAYLAREFDYSLPPSYHITAVHRILKELTGVAEPFADRRRQANEVGLQIAERIGRELDQAPEPAARIRQAALWALAANSLDSRTAGTGYSFDPAGAYDYLFGYYQKDPVIDELEELQAEIWPRAQRILYIHDNVGEIALDGLLIRELRRVGLPRHVGGTRRAHHQRRYLGRRPGGWPRPPGGPAHPGRSRHAGHLLRRDVARAESGPRKLATW